MRAWISALVVGFSFGCSGGGATNDGGAGTGGGGVGGRGGQAGGVAGQAGGAAGQAGGAAGQAGGAAGQAGGAGGQAGTAGAGGRGGSAGAGAGASGRGGSGGASGGGGGSTDGGLSGCQMLAGLSFDSVDERECGRAPPDSGAALCHWRITFTDRTTLTWRHSDYVESGTYTCSGNTIMAQTQTHASLTATLDPTLWRFTWDGVIYVCTSCPP